MSDPFELKFEDLPGEIALFPLPRAILLPRVQMPLNVFEPRYLALAEAALANRRLVGIVQPQARGNGEEIYRTGCAGRISNFSETANGRYMITLKGVCRFDIKKELDLAPGGFRRAVPDWLPYKNDFIENESSDLCREEMMASLRVYFDKMNMMCDKWETMQDISCERLMSILSVVCPFSAEEKQALLEAESTQERARLLKGVIEAAIGTYQTPLSRH